MIIEVLESIASAIKSPYAVICSEDMFARVSAANEELSELIRTKNDREKGEKEEIYHKLPQKLSNV